MVFEGGRSRPVATYHLFLPGGRSQSPVPSPPPEASQLPSGAAATALTRRMALSGWPVPARWPRPRSAAVPGRRRPASCHRAPPPPPHRFGVAFQDGPCPARWPRPRSAPSPWRRRRPASCHPAPPPPPSTPRCVAFQNDPFLPGGHVPDPHRPVAAAGGQPAAIGRHRHRRHPSLWPFREPVPAWWPRPRSAPSRPRRRRPASCHPAPPPPRPPAGVAFEGGPFLPGGHVPDPHRPVPPPVASQLPSGATATAVTQPVWPLGRPVPARWPHPRSAPSCPAAGGQPAAIRRHRHRRHPAGMADQRGPFLPGGHIPDPHRASRPPEASQLPSGATATALHPPVCPSGWPVLPVATSQIRTLVSAPPVASQLPSGATATAVTRRRGRSGRPVPARWPRPRSALSHQSCRWPASCHRAPPPPPVPRRLASQHTPQRRVGQVRQRPTVNQPRPLGDSRRAATCGPQSGSSAIRLCRTSTTAWAGSVGASRCAVRASSPQARCLRHADQGKISSRGGRPGPLHPGPRPAQVTCDALGLSEPPGLQQMLDQVILQVPVIVAQFPPGHPREPGSCQPGLAAGRPAERFPAAPFSSASRCARVQRAGSRAPRHAGHPAAGPQPATPRPARPAGRTPARTAGHPGPPWPAIAGQPGERYGLVFGEHAQLGEPLRVLRSSRLVLASIVARTACARSRGWPTSSPRPASPEKVINDCRAAARSRSSSTAACADTSAATRA